MDLRRDDAGQAILLGAVLLIGILTVVMSIYQAAWVPAENKEIEFDAYQEAVSDMKQLKTAYLDAASTGNVLGQVVKTGARYPSRIFFVNPPNPVGRISTTDPGDVTLNNFTASDSLSDYWDGSTHAYPTRKLRFAPVYNELSVPDTTFAPWGPIYQNASGRYVMHSPQFLVNGTNLQLLLLKDGIDESGYTSEVDVEDFQPYRVVRIRNDTHRPSIEVPSTIPAERWRTDDDLLESELSTGDVHAVEQAGPDRVRVVLERETTYTLKVAGQSLPPDLVESTQTVAESGLEGGVGVAGISDFEFRSSETLSTQGGIWTNIDDLESLNISDPRFVPLTGDSYQQKEDNRYFRLVFTIENSTTRYTFILPTSDPGIYTTLPDTTSFSNTGVTVYKYEKGGASSADVFIGSPTTRLENSSIDAWYNDDHTMDLLNSLTYDRDVQTELDEIKSLTDGNETAELFVGHMHGRVFMEIGTSEQDDGTNGTTTTYTYIDCPATATTGTVTNCTNAQSAGDGGAVANLTEADTQQGQGGTKYALDVEANFSGVPSGANELRVRYRITGDTEPVDLQVGDGAGGWTTQGTLSSTTFANVTHILTDAEYDGGSPRIRFVDTDGSDGTQTTVEVDYARIETN